MKFTRMIGYALIAAVAGIFAPAAEGIIAPGPRPRPTPPPGWTYVWVAPIYRMETVRNWIPGASQWISEWREVWPGRWEQVWREITTPGHWEMVTRQVQVSPGRWELVRVDPPPVPMPPPIIIRPPVVIRNPGTVGVDGYGRAPVEDLSKFSPLTEWPK